MLCQSVVIVACSADVARGEGLRYPPCHLQASLVGLPGIAAEECSALCLLGFADFGRQNLLCWLQAAERSVSARPALGPRGVWRREQRGSGCGSRKRNSFINWAGTPPAEPGRKGKAGTGSPKGSCCTQKKAASI